MPTREEVERFSPDYLQMEIWRELPRALTEGLSFLLAASGDGGQGTGSGYTKSLQSRSSEGYQFFGLGTPPPGAGRRRIYLPRNEAEGKAQYEFRRDHLTVLDSDFDDAIADVYGSILPKPIQVDVDAGDATIETVERFLDNVDRNGQSLDALFASTAQDSASEGLSWIWVDATPASEPKLAHIRGREVPYVERMTDQDTGRTVLGVMDIDVRNTAGERIRRIYMRGNPAVNPGQERSSFARYVTFRVLRFNDKDNEWEDVTEDRALVFDSDLGGVMLPPNGLAPEDERRFVEIPAYPIYSGYLSPFYARPRHIKLAEMALLKFVKASSLEGFLHFVGLPREQFIGGTLQELAEANQVAGSEGGLAAGQGNVIATGRPEAKLEMYEHKGTASGALQKSLEDLQVRIDRAAANTMLREASGRELVGVSALREQRKITRLEVDRAWWQQGVQWAINRAMLWLVGSGVEARVVFPDPSPWRLMGAQNAGQRVLDLMLADKLSSVSGLQMLCMVNEIPKPEGWTPEDEPARLAEEMV